MVVIPRAKHFIKGMNSSTQNLLYVTKQVYLPVAGIHLLTQLKYLQ